MAIKYKPKVKPKKKVAVDRLVSHKRKLAKKESDRIQSEAKAKAKRADRSDKTKQVQKRLLPSVGKDPARLRNKLKGKSAGDIARKFKGKEIAAMQRKITDPKILTKLKEARKLRNKRQRELVEEDLGNFPWMGTHQGKGHLAWSDRVMELQSKFDKKGGPVKLKRGSTVKRKSGGNMSTDGNSLVASLYKGGKVGG